MEATVEERIADTQEQFAELQMEKAAGAGTHLECHCTSTYPVKKYLDYELKKTLRC